MEFGIIKHVKEKNKRNKIYIPKHKQWIELSKELDNVDGMYSYEIVRLKWRQEFGLENYIEDNFDNLYAKPANIIYPEPERTEEDFEM